MVRAAGQEEKQHKQEVELAAVDVKAFKKMSLEEKKAVRRKKDKLKHAKLAKTKLHSKILTCSQCGDRFAGPVSTAARQRRSSLRRVAHHADAPLCLQAKWTYEDDVYCSQYCHDESSGW